MSFHIAGATDVMPRANGETASQAPSSRLIQLGRVDRAGWTVRSHASTRTAVPTITALPRRNGEKSSQRASMMFNPLANRTCSSFT